MPLSQLSSFLARFNRRSQRWSFWLLVVLAMVIIGATQATAQSLTYMSKDPNTDLIATLWMLIAGALVFFMNAGFAMLETGFCRTSNATNVLAKNLIVFCVASFAYWLIGFGLMFGDSGDKNSLLGQTGFLFDAIFPSQANPQPFPEGFSQLQQSFPGRSFTALFFFQLVFAGTTGTIVSGAVAERIKFWAFVLFSFFLVGFSYSVTGHWAWSSQGWLLNSLKFRDFAGSTVVHSVGGVAALVGAILLKPRNGRFGYNYKENRFASVETEVFFPYNLGFATLGCFILWLGWFGFNGGSSLYLENVPHVIVTTMIAGAFGGLSPILFSYLIIGKPRLGSIINGILGGLVGITASSAYVNIQASIIIGLVSGMIVLIVESLLEKAKIDDPVGAVPVHLGCGFWGTMAVGIFSDPNSVEYAGLDPGSGLYHSDHFTQLFYQFLGWLIICGFTALFSWIAWIIVGIVLYYSEQMSQRFGKKSIKKNTFQSSQQLNLVDSLIHFHEIGRKGLRFSEDEEREGRDGVFYNEKLRFKN